MREISPTGSGVRLRPHRDAAELESFTVSLSRASLAWEEFSPFLIKKAFPINLVRRRWSIGKRAETVSLPGKCLVDSRLFQDPYRDPSGRRKGDRIERIDRCSISNRAIGNHTTFDARNRIQFEESRPELFNWTHGVLLIFSGFPQLSVWLSRRYSET